jgi:hypothetical protein
VTGGTGLPVYRVSGGPSTREGRSAQQALAQIAPIWADAVNFTVTMLQLQASAAQPMEGSGLPDPHQGGAACDGAVGRALSKSSGRALVDSVPKGFFRGLAQDLGLARKSGAYSWTDLRQACFSGRMRIDVPGGKKRADAIRNDDWVASRNEFDPDAPIEYKQVEEVFVNVAAIVNLHVGGQIIETTARHPFYVPGEGWVQAGSLRIGDFVSGRDGQLLLVHRVAPSGRVETVYNWRIGEHHTYFVSASEAHASIWAHNQYDPSKPGPKTDNRFGHNRTIRELSKGINDGEILIDGQRGQVIKGGRRGLKEAVVETKGRFRNSRRPDILVRLEDGSLVGINVGRTNSSGIPVTRELLALHDLQNFGKLPMFFVAFGR